MVVAFASVEPSGGSVVTGWVGLLLAVAAGIVIVLMTVVWLISRKIGNAGIVDVAWSANFTLLAVLFALGGDGHPARRLVAGGLMCLWSLRLAIHLGRRVLGDLEHEDGRYAALRESWGENADHRMFWFFQFQGVVNVVLAVPVLLASVNGAPVLRPVEWVGIAVWVVAIAGETIADRQLARFKADPANRGEIMDEGLWHYSRHPNYFFESLVWVGAFLFALGSPWGWITFYCPLVMGWFLYRVTGIPATENHMLRTRGEAFRRYQERTSAFIPWFPRDRGDDR